MITVLHAGLLDDRLVLWAERAEAAPARPRGRHPLKEPTTPRPHPFAATQRLIKDTLAESGLYLTVPGRRPTSVTAWLPSTPRVPLPSSTLLPEADSTDVPQIMPWRIPCILLPSGQEIALLLAVADRHILSPGVVVGNDVAFWVDAVRLAAGMVIRQRFLPGIEIREGVACAVWEPVPAAADRERAASLSTRMPPAARALTPRDHTESPNSSARDVLARFIGVVVDRLVRMGLGRETTDRARSPRVGPVRPTLHTAHDHWVRALTSHDGAMTLDAKEAVALREQIEAWRRPLTVTEAAPYRVCFRLEEPTTDEGGPRRKKSRQAGWQVRYLVQPADDPSLQVPLSDAWSARGTGLSALRREGADLRQFLLASLGQASGICPRIEASLKTTRPSGYELDTAGAYEFLTMKALLLEEAGFGVMLPAWSVKGRAGRRLEVRGTATTPRLQAGSGLTLDRIVTVDWEVALGGEGLTAGELEELARLKAPLVRLRGQWVEMTPGEIDAALKVWTQAQERTTVRDLVHMALGVAEPKSGLPMTDIAARGPLGLMLEQLRGHRPLEDQSPPKAFAGTLRPYQIRGYSWLTFLRGLGFGACLADDMGLGKTVQALAFIQRERARGERRPVLLICPTSVVTNWEREAARFTPDLPVMVHHGVDRAKGAAFRKAVRRQGMVISSYALLHRDLAHLSCITWAGVILDEAQNIKNPETKQARAARALNAGFRIALTGTPVENNVGDLWSLMEFLNQGLLGSQASFRRRFFLPIQSGEAPEAGERLKRITGPFVLRRLKTDRSIISDLPDKQEIKVYCGLTKEQASLYRAVARDAEEALEGAEGITRKGVVLATLTKLKQVCNHPAHFLADGSALVGRSGKLARLSEMLDENLAAGDRALVFTQFAEMGSLLQRHLQETLGVEVPFLHGGVLKKRRDALVDRFQKDDGLPVFLLSLKAGGTGLNLTGASRVFHFDRWWNPAVENQATDRAFRIGQTRDVQVYKFLCAGTLEEAIDDMIERKKGIAERVVGTGEGWLTELSNDELRQVLALRAEEMEQ